jgi:NNP family nitrate/nitrite transporter-like MFS transporter
MSMGTCFGIVSYVDGPNTGTVAGIVGAGGNVGAVWLGRIFMNNPNYQDSMEYMGWFSVVLAFLSPLIVSADHEFLLSKISIEFNLLYISLALLI